MMNRKEQFAEVERLLERLRAASLESPVLVEGDRDVAALRALGLEGGIEKLNRGESIVSRTDRLAHTYPKIIVLTDWDYKGVELHDRLLRLLKDAQVEADDFFWSRLKRLAGGGCRTVESLPSYLAFLKERAGAGD